MLKIALAAGLMLSPATLLAQTSAPSDAGTGAQAGAAASGDTGMASGAAQGSMTHGSSASHHRRHTARGASLSRDTQGTQNTSNSKSSPLNPMPH